MIQSTWQHNDIDIDGKSMHYVRTGGRDKPVLVLVHGFSDDGLCWIPTARDLEDDYDILMPDARGHGRSGRVEPGEVVDQTADLAHLLETLDVDSAIVAGHSMGAWMASELGARFPGLTRAIILEDVPWWLPGSGEEVKPPLGAESPLAKWIHGLAGLTTEEIVAQERSEHPTWSDEALRLWCDAKTRLDPDFLEIASMERMDWQDVAGAIACPTLLIVADPDKGGIVTPDVAALATDLNAHIEVAQIPNVGHHVRFEAYEAYMDAFCNFLAKVT
jgi:pimeloyl-ACP methyl ester carboxylesterase